MSHSSTLNSDEGSSDSQNGSSSKKDKNVYQSFISGGISGVLAKTVIAPLERIKIIYLTSQESFRYLAAIRKTREVTREEGFFSLWRGNALQCFRVFFYSSIVS